MGQFPRKLRYLATMYSKSFKGSCTGNGIISGKPWAIYKKFCDKINLHTKLYISPFYKKIVSWRICLKRHSATFFCRNSIPNTTLVIDILKNFVIKLIYIQSCTFCHFTKKIVSWRISLKSHSATFFCGNSLPNSTLDLCPDSIVPIFTKN